MDASRLAGKLGVEEAVVAEALQSVRDAGPSGEAGEKPDRDAREAALATSLAEALGLEESAVQTALDELQTEQQAERSAALQERLDAAVQDGTLTQEEAGGAAKAVAEGVIGRR